MKIAYFIEGMFNSGGMERVISMKANWLAENTDISVSVVTYSQPADSADFFPLSSEVNRVRLEVSDEDYKTGLCHKLTDWLNKNPQDICISTYGREFKVLPSIKFGGKRIVEFHFAYDINKHWMANGSDSLKTRLIGQLKTWLMVRYAKRYDRIVCLTSADEKRWNSRKAVRISNPVTITCHKSSICQSKIVVALGRMDHQKGFDLLLDSWNHVEKQYPDWELKIYGGGNRIPYIQRIRHLNLKNVELYDRSEDVSTILQNASIFVLSSRYEGFSLAIVEAMSCGLPVVSFDCPSGPGELIEDGCNGFLIGRVGDVEGMAKAMMTLMENEEMRREFGKNSLRISKRYQIDSIMKEWVSLFESLCNQKIRVID